MVFGMSENTLTAGQKRTQKARETRAAERDRKDAERLRLRGWTCTPPAEERQDGAPEEAR